MNDIKHLCGAKKKPYPNPTNYEFSRLYAQKKYNKETIPSSFSIKEKFPQVYTQRYGNCTSNAVLACDVYYYHKPKGDWVPSTTFTYYNQRVLEHSGFDEDDGSSVEMALNALRKYGACSSIVWPNDKPWNEKPNNKAYKDGKFGKEITRYYSTTSLLQIKKAIASGYPVACSMTWAFNDDEHYILKSPTREQVKKCDLGHAIVIVGYNNKTRLFEIRNSWGQDWCNNGYAYIRYEDMKICIWFDDAYAIVR